ncbi:hypothetical protein EOI86_06945 [Hwanghaeella grinnelliae]|uniref:Uncharacterized protein n=1 Tax=Hwanghaeella grinnelliae TaxID=2500179 RepID=A0A437QWS9_9PROT|nr:hypothetical protein [Hwanghaeella grinnelliae]RVU38990.1 hypothetical protein EOI86_06945 [Hwanghaeella grinnelliae]
MPNSHIGAVILAILIACPLQAVRAEPLDYWLSNVCSFTKPDDLSITLVADVGENYRATNVTLQQVNSAIARTMHDFGFVIRMFYSVEGETVAMGEQDANGLFSVGNPYIKQESAVYRFLIEFEASENKAPNRGNVVNLNLKASKYDNPLRDPCLYSTFIARFAKNLPVAAELSSAN